MPYATLEQMLERFERPDDAELTQLTAAAGGVRDDARIGSALAEASGQMDLYIGARHTLPLSGIDAARALDLTRLCCDIARYRLWADAASTEVRTRYEDAVRVLEQIAAGRIRLTGPEAPGAPRATASAKGRRMTRDGLDGVL